MELSRVMGLPVLDISTFFRGTLDRQQILRQLRNVQHIFDLNVYTRIATTLYSTNNFNLLDFHYYTLFPSMHPFWAHTNQCKVKIRICLNICGAICHVPSLQFWCWQIASQSYRKEQRINQNLNHKFSKVSPLDP